MNLSPAAGPPIKKIAVSCYTVPTDTPEADGTLEWKKTTLVLVEASAGDETGLGYSYADVSTGKLVESALAKVVEQRNAFDIAGAHGAMLRETRNLGRAGVVAMAVSAVDNALWDLKAKLLQLSLLDLLGAVRDRARIYGSGGFTSYSQEQLEEQLAGWIAEGIQAVKMKIGTSAREDPDRVEAAREAIGPDARLFVDANGAYTRKQALEFSEIFCDCGVTWFEEPVSSDDLAGLRLLRDRAPAGMDIAAGEYGYDSPYFLRMLQAGAVDVLQADATRCAGVTGFLQAAVLCEAHGLPFSFHCAPALHAAPACAVACFSIGEYFFDHARIERLLFEGGPRLEGGALVPDRSRPGLGFDFKRADARKYAV